MAGRKTIEVAIIGAGITSLCLAHGLLKNPKISVNIYEARAELGHDTTGVGIAANGQKALSLISPELHSCLAHAGAVRNVPEVRFMLGPTNAHVADARHDPPNMTVVRSRFIAEMLKLVPAGVLKTGKRLRSLDQLSHRSKVELCFEDGSEAVVDGVIGCDGIGSFVRRHVLGDESAELEARWLPGFNTRIMIPISEARSVFGDDYCALRTQTGWIGQGGFCLTDLENDGETMQVIAGFRADKPVSEVFGKPFVEVSKEFWLSRLEEGWGWIGERICTVIQNQDKVYAASGRLHPPTPRYNSGRVCIAGDAARAFAPGRGAGASQGIEDALVMSSILQSTDDPGQLEKAFDLYNQLRWPRREQVAEYSNQGSILITGRDPDCGIDINKLREKIQHWNDLIYEYDLEGLQQRCKDLIQAGT